MGNRHVPGLAVAAVTFGSGWTLMWLWLLGGEWNRTWALLHLAVLLAVLVLIGLTALEVVSLTAELSLNMPMEFDVQSFRSRKITSPSRVESIVFLHPGSREGRVIGIAVVGSAGMLWISPVSSHPLFHLDPTFSEFAHEVQMTGILDRTIPSGLREEVRSALAEDLRRWTPPYWASIAMYAEATSLFLAGLWAVGPGMASFALLVPALAGLPLASLFLRHFSARRALSALFKEAIVSQEERDTKGVVVAVREGCPSEGSRGSRLS